MKYALLLYADEKRWQEATEEERSRRHARHDEYTALLEARGALLGGEGLSVSTEAVSLRKESERVPRTGSERVLRTDGPFVETVEHLGGFYLIEAADLDEAIELATACPEDIIEVRPVVEYTEPMA